MRALAAASVLVLVVASSAAAQERSIADADLPRAVSSHLRAVLSSSATTRMEGPARIEELIQLGMKFSEREAENATGGKELVWWVGLLCLIAGGLLPVLTRYMDHSADTIRDVGMEYDDRIS